MKALFNGTCAVCKKFKPRCAVIAIRGCNIYGDRERRALTVCHDCRKQYRGLYIVHPKHKRGANP